MFSKKNIWHKISQKLQNTNKKNHYFLFFIYFYLKKNQQWHNFVIIVNIIITNPKKNHEQAYKILSHVHNHIVNIYILVKCQISTKLIDEHKHLRNILESPKFFLSLLCAFLTSECLRYLVMPSFFSDEQCVFYFISVA